MPVEDIWEPIVFSLTHYALSLLPSPHRDPQGRWSKASSKPLGLFHPVSSQEQKDLREKGLSGRYWGRERRLGEWKLHAAG